MDPNTGIIYDEHEMMDLPPEVRERLISGELEDLKAMSKLIDNIRLSNHASGTAMDINSGTRVNRTARNIGVDFKVKADRRAKAKQARKARRRNRG